MDKTGNPFAVMKAMAAINVEVSTPGAGSVSQRDGSEERGDHRCGGEVGGGATSQNTSQRRKRLSGNSF